ncbi:hypothetical protein AB0M48_35115 [Lentzea sp. NPDC051208]|uniref:hypothetical protein n=1 Tax=Lentzea sp. NPDC051208 TaxID=3154642 RepID=UPI00343FB111
MTLLQAHEQGAVVSHLPQPRGEVRVFELDLVAVPSAITCARLLVGYAAIKWQLAPACEQELGDVAKALVQQAITTESGRPEVLNYLAFRLRLVPRAVVVEVWDSRTEAPPSLPASSADDGGYDFPGRGRRVMWCAVRSRLAQEEPGLNTPAGIPRRQRLQGPVRDSVAVQDPQLLRRVLSGLRALDASDGAGADRS